MSIQEWDLYRQEVEDSKNDVYLYVPNNLRVTLSHIIKQFNLDDPNKYWVFQHWQALPKPVVPYFDKREFGYFIYELGNLRYKTIPAEHLTIVVGVEIIPLQYRAPAVNTRVPIAGNLFPDATINPCPDKGTFLLKRV